MNDAVQRAQIKDYLHKAFLAKIMQMNEVRQRKKLELRGELGRHGHSANSSAWMIGEIEIEEDCIAGLLRQKAELYIDAYKRVGLAIGPEVLKDIAHSQVELTATRKSSLIGEAQLLAARTNRVQNLTGHAHLGKKASVAMKEIEANIDLYNLAHSATVTDGARRTETAQMNLHQDDPTPAQSTALGGEGGVREELDGSATSSAVHSATKETIWAQMWSWVVVGTIDLAILGAGIAFLTSGHPSATDIFLLVGAILFVAKFWTWEEARRQPPFRKWMLQTGATVLSFAATAVGIYWNHAINRSIPASQLAQPAAAGTERVPSGRMHDNENGVPPEPQREDQAGKSRSSAAGGRTISLGERVKIIIAGCLEVNEADIKPNDDFEADLGADPTDVYFLMRSLEQEYDITIPSSDSKNLHTVSETITYIEKRTQQKRQGHPKADGLISITQRVEVIVAHHLHVDPAKIRPSDDFEVDLGANPTDVYFLMRDLEQEYNIKIPADDSKGLHTVAQTISYIETREGRK
jgi:acyl carrier protein